MADNYDANAILQETRDKLDRPDKFADIFCKAAKSQVNIKECLSDIIKDLLLNDKDINKHLEDTLANIARKDAFVFFAAFLKKAGWVVGIIVTGVVTLGLHKLGKVLGL